MSRNSKQQRKVNDLDIPLGLVYAQTKSEKTGEAVGIELEIEPAPRNALPLVSTAFWLTIPEGSLRGGYEYVNAKPIPISTIPEVVNELFTYLKPAKLLPSIRCSTHVHVNIGHLTTRQVLNVLAFYYLIEDILVSKHGDYRKGNLFCLRMSDAEGIMYWVKDIVRTGPQERLNLFHNFTKNEHKYAALNLVNVHRLGTLEFRFLRPSTDAQDMERWASLLARLVYTGVKFSVRNTLDYYNSQATAKQFMSRVLGQETTEFLLENLTYSQVTEMIHRNYDFVFDLERMMRPIKFFELPRKEWTPDLMSYQDIEMEEMETMGTTSAATVPTHHLFGAASQAPQPVYSIDEFTEEPDWDSIDEEDNDDEA